MRAVDGSPCARFRVLAHHRMLGDILVWPLHPAPWVLRVRVTPFAEELTAMRPSKCAACRRKHRRRGRGCRLVFAAGGGPRGPTHEPIGGLNTQCRSARCRRNCAAFLQLFPPHITSGSRRALDEWVRSAAPCGARNPGTAPGSALVRGRNDLCSRNARRSRDVLREPRRKSTPRPRAQRAAMALPPPLLLDLDFAPDDPSRSVRAGFA